MREAEEDKKKKREREREEPGESGRSERRKEDGGKPIAVAFSPLSVCLPFSRR